MTTREGLHPLLSFLADQQPAATNAWQGWQLRRVEGGWNNLLYRATNADADLAIKFSVHDERDRAGREYDALAAVCQAGLDITPKPVLLDRNRYRQPVVVQTWVDGAVSIELPTDDDAWEKLLRHLVAIHTITPEGTHVPLRPAVLTAFSAGEARTLIDEHLARIPVADQPAELVALVDACKRASFPEWDPPAPTLCRVDSAIQNFIQRPGCWASVDWENAGWGDPAFEIADLITHAAHVDLPSWRRDWIANRYAELSAQPKITERIMTYHQILAVWWAVRTYRYLYEIPRGLDLRLAAMPDDWQTAIRAKYEHYLALAATRDS